MDAEISAVRRAPAPLIHAADAIRMGTHPADDSALHRVRRAVYTPKQDWEALPEWDRYLLRVHAFALARPDAVFSHESAAALLGLPIFGHPRRIHIFDARRERSLVYGDVVAHTSVDFRATLELDGIHVCTVDDVVLDLARVLPPAFGLAVGDAAVRARRLESPRLVERAALQRNPNGRKRLDWVIERIDARAESVVESVSRAVAEWCGFPQPALQREHRVAGRLYRSDFCWPEHKVIGEADGWSKYDPADARLAAEAVRDEKRREDALRRAGWRVARWDYSGALRVDGLREGLSRAGLPTVTRPDTAALRSVGVNRRSL
jgi:hypothetical protein